MKISPTHPISFQPNPAGSLHDFELLEITFTGRYGYLQHIRRTVTPSHHAPSAPTHPYRDYTMLVFDLDAYKSYSEESRMLAFQLVYHIGTASIASGVPKLRYLFPASVADGVGADNAVVLIFDGLLLHLPTVMEWLPPWEEHPAKENSTDGYYACGLAKAMDQAIELERQGRFHVLHHFDHTVYPMNVVINTAGEALVCSGKRRVLFFEFLNFKNSKNQKFPLPHQPDSTRAYQVRPVPPSNPCPPFSTWTSR